jgi:hypothetical protein
MLNDLGKKKAMDDCEDLTNLPKYTDGSSEVQD